MSYYSIITKKVPTKFTPIGMCYNKLGSVENVQQGIVSRSSSFSSFDFRQQFGNVPASSFTIENIVSAGAVDLLKVRSFNNSDVDALSNAADEQLKSLENGNIEPSK